MNEEILIIVDPQIDFTTKEGSLYVPGAELAMQNLAKYINNNDFDNIIVTCDWHPTDHCSFKENGGYWPVHCVGYTKGCAIDPTLCKILLHKNFELYEKGMNPNKEEYSFLDDIDNNEMFTSSVSTDSKIYIAGVAGDFCVYHTIVDLLNLGYKNLIVLINCIASIDKGEKLNKIINSNYLNVI